MDLHISNLDPETTASGLKHYLRDQFKAFGVTTFDCNKPKNKRYGFITLPEAEQGRIILGKLQYSLFFVNRLIIKAANHPPDPQKVEALRKRQWAKVEDEQPSRGNYHGARKFSTDSWSCGTLCYHNGKLAFRKDFEDERNGILIFGRKSLTLTTPPYNGATNVQSTKIEIPYSAIEKVLTDGITTPTITLNLFYAPKVVHLPKLPANLAWSMARLLLRDRERDRPLRVRGANEEHEQVVSNAFAYRFHVSTAWASHLSNYLEQARRMPSHMRYSLKEVIFQNNGVGARLRDLESNLALRTDLDFETKFQLQRLAQNGFLQPTTVVSLLDAVAAMPKDKLVKPAQAVRHMARDLPWPGPDVEPAELEPEAITTSLDEGLESNVGVQYVLAKRHKHLYLIHIAHVTPSGVYLEGPELCPANRVLRKYHQFAESHMLRVKFEDENGSPIRYDRVNSLEPIHNDWFKKRLLDQGISIAGRRFRFLGFSNSSLKDQCCWFMADFCLDERHYTSWDVIRGLGNFSTIRSPAKLAARIGQVFSDTHGGTVSISRVTTLPDVERNNRVFSDGCGTVSKDMLKKIWRTYRRNVKPTCFQIRQAGAKGMVSLDSRLEGEKLNIRPSMLKFQAVDTDLEICDASRRALPFFLNKQIIKILEDLKVPASSFIKLQSEHVTLLRANANSPTRAADFLERYAIGKGCSLPWLIQRLDALGMSPFEDTFLSGCVEHAVLTQLRMIKYRARISVPNAYTLFGIMDETDSLPERRIVCRASGKTVTGVCAITRSPALHPGDIQVVRAVDVPEGSPLLQLDNCVIFSQRGERDLPSQLSGGDLDGDLYNLIFDPSLIPPVITQPANYPRVTAQNLPYPELGLEHITQWFIKFLQNDQLSRIAIMHQHLADVKPSGTFDPDCLLLAELHSTAVDFQKSGIEVDMTRLPRAPKAKPDFMAPNPRLLMNATSGQEGFKLEEEDFEPSGDEEAPDSMMDPDNQRRFPLFYESQKVLGKLFRAIDECEFLEEFESKHRRSYKSSITKQLLAHIEAQTHGIQWNHLVDWAWGVREEYEEMLMDLLQSFSPEPRQPLTEVEAFTGEIIGRSGNVPTRQVREKAMNMKERFNEGVAYIVQRIIHGGSSGVAENGHNSQNGEDNDDDATGPANADYDIEANWWDTSTRRDEALERSIACLSVGMQKGSKWGSIGKRRLVSFQYVAGMVALRECDIFTRRNATSLLGVQILRMPEGYRGQAAGENGK